MDRRKFIILTGVGATSAGVLSACGHPEDKLIPALIPDDEYVPGVDYWKASACGMCAAGCGIIVRTREHKANKIEGNPLHPVNRGALCARGQAGLQLLYNPDRIRGPMRRTGERGSGQFEEITWDEAIKMLADKLREIKSQQRSQQVFFLTGGPINVDAHVALKCMDSYGARCAATWPQFNENQLQIAHIGAYGSEPIFDVANATYLLSFGARFLETWRSPVMYSLAYGEFRQAKNKPRGRFVQVEPRMSLTAANADEWIPARPGTEGAVALAIAQVMIREGLAKSTISPELVKSLESYAPEKTVGRTDVSADRLIRIAREFASSERPLAIAGGAATVSDGPDGIEWANFLNLLADNTNKKGGVITSANSAFDPFQEIGLHDRRRLGEIYISALHRVFDLPVNALLIHNVNPVYAAPAIFDKIREIPFIASFSSFIDETSQLADLILPDNTYLERWNLNYSLATNDSNVVSLTKPVITSAFNTRQTADVMLALSRELGGDVSASLPFASAEEIVRKAASNITKAVRGGASITPENEEEFWNTLTERGVWINSTDGNKEDQNKAQPSKTTSINLPPEWTSEEEKASQQSEYPLTILTYEHATLGDGSFANLPALQELPDPLTSVMWGSWVEINPQTAASLGIADGDVIEVTTPHGSVRAPAVIYPAIRPDVIAMPYGQGHTFYGRYANGKGANLAALNLPGDEGSSKPIVRAKVSKITSGSDQIRFGTMLPEHIHVKR